MVYKIDHDLKNENKIKYYVQKFLHMGVFLVIVYPLLIFYAIKVIFVKLSCRHVDIPFVLTCLFLVVNVIYVTVICNSFEYGENNRYRFMIDPFYLVLFGLFLTYRFRILKPK